MPKHQRTADERHRDTIESAVRQIRAAMQTYWSLCNSWCAGAPLDNPELRHRMMTTRAHAIAMVCALMPVPSFDTFDEAEALRINPSCQMRCIDARDTGRVQTMPHTYSHHCCRSGLG